MNSAFVWYEDVQISEGVFHLKPSASACNTPVIFLNLHNSSYHTQPRPMIANYTALSSRQLKQSRWIFGFKFDISSIRDYDISV